MAKLLALQESLVLIARKNVVFADAVHIGNYDDDDDGDDVYLIEITTCGLYKIYRLYALT